MTTSLSAILNPIETVATLRRIIPPGAVTEIRILDCILKGDRWTHITVSGYFDDDKKLAAELARIESARGVYFIPNAIDPSLLARAANRLKPCKKGDPTTADHDVLERRYLLIDLDVVRPAGISATDDEHAAALVRASEVRDWLSSCGWPMPIEGDSGNGGHELYAVELPRDDAGLLARCLAALQARFGDDRVKIDETVFNPSRIWKLPGSLAGKGDSTADRPHRYAGIISFPEQIQIVSRNLLEALAAEAPVSNNSKGAYGSSGSGNGGANAKFNLADWIRLKNLDVTGPDDWKGGHRWVFKVCPWNSDHTNGSAFLAQLSNGAISAGCHHNGCKAKGWHDLRDVVEPDWRTQRDWPEPTPLPSAIPAVMPFDADLLPEAFRPWIVDIAERVQCPPDFPAVGAMVALASIVGRRIGIRPKRHDDWLVVPNLWGAVIGRPGIMKTPALQETLRPLIRLEIEAKERFTQAQSQYEASEIVREARTKLMKKAIETALKNGENADAIAAEHGKSGAEVPCRRRYVMNDSTVEKLGEVLNQNPNGVLCMRDELVGLLKQLEKDGQESARAFYLEAWNGTGRFTYDRISRGTIDIEAACVSIIGGIQPGPLSEYTRSARDNGAGDDGFLQRFQLAVYPDLSAKWHNVDRWPDTPAKNVAFEVFRRLEALDPAGIGATTVEDDPTAIPFLRFSPEAQPLFDEWRGKLEHRLRSGEEPTVMEAHLAKYRSLIPSLALLIHLADDAQGSVGSVALRKAIRWGEYLETHARRIFAVAADTGLASAKALAEKIVEGRLAQEFSLKDVYRPCWTGLSDREAAESAVEYLLDLDWLQDRREQTGGAPRTRYFVNPKIWGLPKEPTAKTAKSPSETGSAPPYGSNGSADLRQSPENTDSKPPSPESKNAPEEAFTEVAEAETGGLEECYI